MIKVHRGKVVDILTRDRNKIRFKIEKRNGDTITTTHSGVGVRNKKYGTSRPILGDIVSFRMGAFTVPRNLPKNFVHEDGEICYTYKLHYRKGKYFE